jgi:anti-sigma factor RsiW
MHREHRYAQRRLSAAVDDALTPREKARVVRHVSECPECGPMLRGLIVMRGALRAMGSGDAPRASVVPGVLAHLASATDWTGAARRPEGP